MGKAIRFVAVIGAVIFVVGLTSCSSGTASSSSSASASSSSSVSAASSASSASTSSAPSESASSASDSSKSSEPIDDGTTDQMWRDSQIRATLYVYVKDGEAYTPDYGYEVNLLTEQPLKDGSYYEVVADVDFLNGGIAGYVNYPEIKHVYSCKEVSREDVPGSSKFD